MVKIINPNVSFLLFFFFFFIHLYRGISQLKYCIKNLSKYYMGSEKKLKIPLLREKNVNVHIVK